MDEKPKRRWFWFRPWGLLVLVTLASVALWLAFSATQYRREKVLLDHMEREKAIRP